MKNEELKEQAKVVRWCREKGLKICATAQSTFTTSWKTINNNKMSGVVRGLPDLIIIIPPELRNDNHGQLIFIEMKKVKGGVVSKEQKQWLADLDDCRGVISTVCHGAKEAKSFLSPLIEIVPVIPTGKELENLIHNM